MSQVEESAPSPRLQRASYSLFVSVIVFLILLFLLHLPILGTIAPAILATGTKAKAHHLFSLGSASEGASSRRIRTPLSIFDQVDLHVRHWIIIMAERSGLHITSAPPHWNSGSDQKVCVMRTETESNDFPLRLNLKAEKC